MHVALSTIVSMESLFEDVTGRSVIKSMEISFHFSSGIWVDYSFPLATWCSNFSI